MARKNEFQEKNRWYVEEDVNADDLYDEEGEDEDELPYESRCDVKHMRAQRRQRTIRKRTKMVRLGKGAVGKKAEKAKEALSEKAKKVDQDVELEKRYKERLTREWKKGKGFLKLARHYESYSSKKRQFFK